MRKNYGMGTLRVTVEETSHGRDDSILGYGYYPRALIKRGVPYGFWYGRNWCYHLVVNGLELGERVFVRHHAPFAGSKKGEQELKDFVAGKLDPLELLVMNAGTFRVYGLPEKLLMEVMPKIYENGVYEREGAIKLPR